MLQSTTIKCTQTRNLRKYARTEARGQGHSDPKMEHNTLHLKMHPQTELLISTLNSIRGMLLTRCEDSGT